MTVQTDTITVQLTVTAELSRQAWLDNYGHLETGSVEEVTDDMRDLLTQELWHFLRGWINRTGNEGRVDVEAVAR